MIRPKPDWGARRSSSGAAGLTPRLYLFSASSTFTEARPLTSRPVLLLEIGDRRLALGPDVAVRGAADVVAALRQQRLQFLSPGARQQRIVGRPGGDDAAPAAQAVGEHAGGEGVGFGGIIGIDGVEIARHQKGRPVASGGQQERGVAPPSGRPSMRVRPRAAQKDMDCLALRPDGPE